MDEREFFDERQDRKVFTLNCPHCRQPGEYELGWIVRTKKRQLPPRADERDVRGRQSRVVLAPVAGVKPAEMLRSQPGLAGSSIRRGWRQEEFVSRESTV